MECSYISPAESLQDVDFDVSVIIPLFRSKHDIEEQIRLWSPEDLKVQLVYVDDRCPERSGWAAFHAWEQRKDRQQYGIRVIQPKVNGGFGRSCNIGAHYATGRILVFLNADTIVGRNWLKPLVEVLADVDVGIVGNLQIKHGGKWHGTIDSAGSEWTWDYSDFYHIGRHIHHGSLLEKPFYASIAPQDILVPAEREMVTGCCLAIRKELFTQVGGFHFAYRLGYWEDSELCMTIREAGYKVMFEPRSVIHHKLAGSGMVSKSPQVYTKSVFMNKWVDSGRIDKLVAAPRNLHPTKITNILVTRHEARGDVLVAAGILPALQIKYPNTNLFFCTSSICSSVLLGNPYLTRVLRDADLDDYNFQLSINLDWVYEHRPFTNILKAYAEEAGVAYADCQLYVRRDPVEGLPKDYVVVHGGHTAWAGRNWHGFGEVVKQVQDWGHPVVCVGSESDETWPAVYDLRGRTTVQQLATVMHEARLFIGIDSLPLHVAQSQKTPGVVFFGSINPATRLVNDNIIPVTADLPCLGCHHRQLPPASSLQSCPLGHLMCESSVKPGDMLKVVRSLL